MVFGSFAPLPKLKTPKLKDDPFKHRVNKNKHRIKF